MPLQIRELNIKVEVGGDSGSSEASEAPQGKEKGAKQELVKKAVEEMLRIEAAKRER